jgi:predicted P-loop ATPase
VYLPHGDDDFADDLTRGYSVGDYQPGPPPTAAAEPEIIPPPHTETELIAAARTVTRDAPELQQILKGCVRLDTLARSRVLDVVKESTRYGIVKLEQMVRGYRKEIGYLTLHAGPRPTWVDKLKLWDNGEPKPIQFNVTVALREDPAWRGVIGLNEFTGNVELLRHPPWPNAHWRQVRDWTDDDTLKATEWVQGVDICAPKSIVDDAVNSVANENRFHPVRESLDGLEWDRKPRLDAWLSDYCRVADSSYVRAVGSRFLISAVARVYSPGCKVDCALILEGEQGIGKSTALRALFDPWFTDEIADLGSKDASMQLRGVWGVELAELDAMRRAEVPRLKAFVTRTDDRYRPPYGRHVVDVPRQCVFCGTVNDSEYLRDPTGGRRFWPVKCLGKLDVPGLYQVREQLWAEAVARYRASEPWHLHEDELISTATEEQEKRRSRDAAEEYLQEAFDAGDMPFQRELIVINDVIDYLRDHKKMTVSHTVLSKFLRRVGADLLGQKRIEDGNRKAAVWVLRDAEYWKDIDESVVARFYQRPYMPVLPGECGPDGLPRIPAKP